MDIYAFIRLLNDCDNIIFRLFDCNSGELVFVPDYEGSEKQVNWEADELLWSDYSYCEIGSVDMWTDFGTIYIEFNIEIDEEDGR